MGGKRGDFSGFGHGIAVGAKQAGIFQKLLIFWDFPTQTAQNSSVCRERSEKEKLSSEQQFSGKAIVIQLTAYYHHCHAEEHL